MKKMTAKKNLILYFLLIVFPGNIMASDDVVKGWIILLHEAVCTAYYGYRIYQRDESYYQVGLKEQIVSSLEKIENIVKEMRAVDKTYPIGQYDWLKDAGKALQYRDWALKTNNW